METKSDKVWVVTADDHATKTVIGVARSLEKAKAMALDDLRCTVFGGDKARINWREIAPSMVYEGRVQVASEGGPSWFHCGDRYELIVFTVE